MSQKSVSEILDAQRIESEARDILRDLEKLNSLPEIRKSRWVWELIQNAKDVAYDDVNKPLNISVILSKDKFVFQHDGKPFKIEELIALIRKTSTKPLRGEEGTTGKFGTGFISTHVLNKKVKVSGTIKHEETFIPFSHFIIDRTHNSIETLEEELKNSFLKIQNIIDSGSTDTSVVNTEYEYLLNDYSYIVASQGLSQLEKNLPFTLLINQKIKSIIIDNGVSRKCLSLDINDSGLPDIRFAKIIETPRSSSADDETGLLFIEKEGMYIATNTKKENGTFKILKNVHTACIYRDFPLIGTESFNTPCLIQSDKFQPSEDRDGIRTVKPNEENEDFIADENRRVLEQYVNLVKSFYRVLFENNIKGSHLLAESGLPTDNLDYLGEEWFQRNVQYPIREFLLTQPIVKTVSGNYIKINEADFLNNIENGLDEFYSLLARLMPSRCPDKESYRDWISVIEQDRNNWPNVNSLSVNELVEYISNKGTVNHIGSNNIDVLKWLDDLISFLINNNLSYLDERYALYPNQSDKLCKRSELFVSTEIDEVLKEVSLGMGKNLNDILIHRYFANKKLIAQFDLKQHFINLNNDIGNLKIEDATENQIKSIFKLICAFKDTIAPKREEWFKLVSDAKPDLASTKIVVTGMEDYQWEPSEKWTLKYMCNEIQNQKEISSLKKNIFNGDENKTINWLNKFIQYVFRNEDTKEVGLKYKIIPTQDGIFRIYDDNIYREDDSTKFEDIIKDLYKDYVGKGDPRTILVDNRVCNDSLRITDLNILSRPIDSLFNAPDSEEKVKISAPYNPLFFKLNDWFEQHPELQSYFPVFGSKRAVLNLKACGEGVGKKVMRILSSNKTIDELEVLSKIDLPASEMQELADAAIKVGGSNILLEKAKEIIENAEENRWRKVVGTAAEQAFKEALEQVEPFFQLEQPDRGKDFTIRLSNSDKEFYIEIKSAVESRETVKMTPLQGDTAKSEKDRYALSVISRPSEDIITKEYFMEHSRFNMGIGSLIGDKLDFIRGEINEISSMEDDDVNVSLDKKTFSINVRKKVWEDALTFKQFVNELRKYFDLT